MGVPLYLSLSSPQPEMPPVLGQIPDFELQNQFGETVKYSTHYKGSVLVVNFIFTTCPDVCPLLSKQMSKIQARIVGNSPVIRLLSISVDPANDTPEKLNVYANQYNANPRTWGFLTGDLMQIYDTVVNGFKVPMQNPTVPAGTSGAQANQDDAAIDLMAITHGEHFVILDQNGQIRAYQRAGNDQQIDEVIRTVSILANQNPNNAQANANNAPRTN
jgi:protein SCO1/2